MKLPTVATYRLPLAAGGAAAVLPLIMGAAADASPAVANHFADVAAVAPMFRLTGNPVVDGMILAAVTGPVAGGAVWMLRLLFGVGVAAIATALEAYAAALKRKAASTPSKADDEVSGAIAKGLEAAAARLREADRHKG